MKDLRDDGAISQTVVDEFAEQFHVFGSVVSHIEVLDNFLESFKIISKIKSKK